MFKLFIIILSFEPTWSHLSIVFGNKNTIHYLSSRNDSNLKNVSYFEGELIYASCVVNVEFDNPIFRFKKHDKLIYESKVTNYQLYKSENSVVMQIKMLPEYDNSVLECTDGLNKMSVLILFDDSTPDFVLNVNGIWFPKLPYNLSGHIYYKNSNNEDVIIRVRTKDIITEDVEKRVDSFKQDFSDDDITREILSRRYANTLGRFFGKKQVHTKLTRITIDCGTLCFDPYFVNLDPSKVLAKYISSTARNTSVVTYELDFEEVAWIGCTSASGKGNISFVEGKEILLTHNKTSAMVKVDTSGRFRCESSEDGRVTTTILDVTRNNRNKTTIKNHHGRVEDKTTSISTDKRLKLSKGRSKTLGRYTYDLTDMLIAVFATMITTSVVTTIIYTVCLKRRRSNKPTVDETHTTPSNIDPVYETVGYGTVNEPGEVDRAQREPYPLPPEECEENKKYVHYDTPYEWRIFRSPFRRV